MAVNFKAMADPEIVKEICRNIRTMRINRNISQQALADMSGLDRTTISRMESGRSATLLTIVQILRALDNLNILSVFNEKEPEISPIQLLRLEEKKRKRASKKKNPVISKDEIKSEW